MNISGPVIQAAARSSRQTVVSVILCTCNRASGLRQTLEALGKARIPSGWKAEVIAVDNASSDDTANVIQGTKLENMTVRYFFEGRRGKGHALNTGIKNAEGDFLLFTDDDVIVSEDWVEQMVSPMLEGRCDAVTGQINLPQTLKRPWMTFMHRWWLASSNDAQPNNGIRELIGASMGFRRSVLERVPEFDPELGPGALGLGEDTLFGWQLAKAGFAVQYVPAATVLHQLDAGRLARGRWLNEAAKHGRTEAYLMYHWQHGNLALPLLRKYAAWLRLHWKRLREKLPPIDGEGCPRWEMGLVSRMAFCDQAAIDQRRPRNFEHNGLKKRAPSE